MKKQSKKILLIIAFLTITATGFSQFTFGPKVGANFTNYVDKTSMNAGIDAGIFLRVGQNFYFQPEIEYSFVSTNFKGVWQELENIGKIRNHYINIPLLLGYKFVNNPNFNFRVFIGPRLGLMVSNNFDGDANPFGTVQLGGKAGVGIDFWRFTFDVGYDFSVNQPKQNSSSKEWWKQNMLSVALGFKILKR